MPLDLDNYRKLHTRYLSNGRNRKPTRKRGISKRELGRRLCVSERTIHRWYEDPNTRPCDLAEKLLQCLIDYELEGV